MPPPRISLTSVSPDAVRRPADSPPLFPLPIPKYMEQVYWWAYIHPRSVRLFEHEFLINAILFGNYDRLCGAMLDAMGDTVQGRVLQIACAYGDLTPRLRERLTPDATLDVIDILPIQLTSLAEKMPADPRVTLSQGDSSSLAFPDASFDTACMYFLLHEQPEHVRRATIAEAFRVVKPGGKIVLIDYHRPAPWHPMRPLLRGIFHWLEPFAIDLWTHGIEAYFPADIAPASVEKTTYFGGVYQRLVLTR